MVPHRAVVQLQGAPSTEKTMYMMPPRACLLVGAVLMTYSVNSAPSHPVVGEEFGISRRIISA